MEYSIVYDVSKASLKLIWLACLPFLIVLVVTMMFHIRNKKEGWKTQTIILSLMFLFVLTWGLVGGIEAILGYKEVQRVLAHKNYQTVEGIIENFGYEHKHEHFSVNNVKFEYSNFDEGFYGFNNTNPHGGPIIGNGQKVKIDYYHKRDRNYIFKLMIEKN